MHTDRQRTKGSGEQQLRGAHSPRWPDTAVSNGLPKGQFHVNLKVWREGAMLGRKQILGSLSQTNHSGRASGTRNAMKRRHEFRAQPELPLPPLSRRQHVSQTHAAACRDPAAKRQPWKLRRIIRVYAQGYNTWQQGRESQLRIKLQSRRLCFR